MNKITKVLDKLMIIPAIASFYIIDAKVISVRQTSGKSMEPTIDGNSVLVDRKSVV